MEPHLRPDLFLGEYILKARMNDGVPEVWFALAGSERIPVALKILAASARRPETEGRFYAERSVLRRLLSAPNVVRITGSGEIAGHLFLEQPYVGENLRDILLRTGPLPPPIACALTYGVLVALDATHRLTYPSGLPAGIVHRDVTTANILVAPSGEVFLCDFGAVCVRAGNPVTIPQQFLGTPGYRAPEYATGSMYTHQADLWAAGLVLREMLTGRRLFDPATSGARETIVPAPSADGKPVPAALDRFVLWLCAARPVDRAPTAKVALDELYRLGRLASPAEIARHIYPDESAPRAQVAPIGDVLRPWIERARPIDPTILAPGLSAARAHVDLERREIFFHGRPLPKSGPGERLTARLFFALAYLARRSGRPVGMAELAEGMEALGHRWDRRDRGPDAREIGHKLRNLLYAAAGDLYSSRKSMALVLENVGGALKLHVPASFEPASGQAA